jgi:hypothetical protein
MIDGQDIEFEVGLILEFYSAYDEAVFVIDYYVKAMYTGSVLEIKTS